MQAGYKHESHTEQHAERELYVDNSLRYNF